MTDHNRQTGRTTRLLQHALALLLTEPSLRTVVYVVPTVMFMRYAQRLIEERCQAALQHLPCRQRFGDEYLYGTENQRVFRFALSSGVERRFSGASPATTALVLDHHVVTMWLNDLEGRYETALREEPGAAIMRVAKAKLPWWLDGYWQPFLERGAVRDAVDLLPPELPPLEGPMFRSLMEHKGKLEE